VSIDWGDAPAWGALAISFIAALTAILALKHAKDAASAASISAQAAVRQAAAAERQVEVAEAALKVAEEQASASQTTLATGAARAALASHHAPPYVAWWIENPSGHAYVLRNIGTDAARKVEIDESRIRCMLRGDTTADELPPRASMKILMAGSLAAAKPDELWVRWDGHPEWVAVPVP